MDAKVPRVEGRRRSERDMEFLGCENQQGDYTGRREEDPNNSGAGLRNYT